MMNNFSICGLVSLPFFVVVIGSLLYAMSAECPPHAYHISQLFIAASAGFIHAFIASLVPFVAEECGIQLHSIVQARRGRGGRPDYSAEGFPYAYQPHKWVKVVDGSAHVVFSGGSWYNHSRFACWASGQFLIGSITGVIHAFIPILFPTLAEEVCLELGGLIISRRKLRNKSEGFKNPANLSDMLHGKEWKEKFEAAAKLSVADGDVGAGHTEIDRGKVKVIAGPNQKAKFL